MANPKLRNTTIYKRYIDLVVKYGHNLFGTKELAKECNCCEGTIFRRLKTRDSLDLYASVYALQQFQLGREIPVEMLRVAIKYDSKHILLPYLEDIFYSNKKCLTLIEIKE